MEDKKKIPLKIRSLHIQNFKAFDDFKIEFPPPRMKDDPDVWVIGSRNGVGKTSLLEAIGTLIILSLYEHRSTKGVKPILVNIPVDICDLCIKAGAESALIDGSFIYDRLFDLTLRANSDNSYFFDCKQHIDKTKREKSYKHNNFTTETLKNLFGDRIPITLSELAKELTSAFAINPNPVIMNHFLYFHGFRKTVESNPQIGMINGKNSFDDRYWDELRFNTSSFKTAIVNLMMAQSNLLESMEIESSAKDLEKLDFFIQKYAECKLGKLKKEFDNKLDLRVTSINGGPSYSFNSLSSGQKEIISTLFLIWKYTKDNPGIVLIDEPELHLNHEWHREIMNSLVEIVPENQYICATHSEDVFASVPPHRRIILEESGD